MRKLLLWLIRIYQVNLSPHKGFRCAYHIRTGRRSCSTFGFAAIERHGAIVGLLLLRRRFRKCAHAVDIAVVRPRVPARQAGHCDLPIGDCDFGAWMPYVGRTRLRFLRRLWMHRAHREKISSSETRVLERVRSTGRQISTTPNPLPSPSIPIFW